MPPSPPSMVSDLTPENTSDVTWFEEVARRDCVALSKDKAVLRDKLEVAATVTAGGRLIIAGRQLHTAEYANLLIATRW